MNARLPAELASAADLIAQRKAAEVPFSPYERKRLDMMATIAAGMCSNPQLYKDGAWQRTVTINAMQLTDKMLAAWITGGC